MNKRVAGNAIYSLMSPGIDHEIIYDTKKLDNTIIKMHKSNKTYMLLIKTKIEENVYPMIETNSDHNEMILKD